MTVTPLSSHVYTANGFSPHHSQHSMFHHTKTHTYCLKSDQ